MKFEAEMRGHAARSRTFEWGDALDRIEGSLLSVYVQEFEYCPTGDDYGDLMLKVSIEAPSWSGAHNETRRINEQMRQVNDGALFNATGFAPEMQPAPEPRALHR